MAKKVNKEFGNILRNDRQKVSRYSNYVKLSKDIETNRVSIHERLKRSYGSNYMNNWRK